MESEPARHTKIGARTKQRTVYIQIVNFHLKDMAEAAYAELRGADAHRALA
ncbi:MAG: hypothetical protein U0893_00550 [Chloroflexota bacterium]